MIDIEHKIRAFQNRLQKLYDSGKYDEVRDLLSFHWDEFIRHFDLLSYWKACMEALAGNTEGAFSSLEAILDRGLCVPGNQLEEDPDFSDIRGTERFQTLLAANKRARSKRMIALAPKLKMPFIHQEASKYAVCFLHGNTRNGLLEHRVFSAMPSLKETMYFPDAPEQSFLQNSYVWDDFETSYRYVAGIVGVHQKQTGQKVLLSGYSFGARTALKIVYEKNFAADGVIIYAPAMLRDIDTWDFLRHAQKVPIEIIVGEKDDLSYPFCGKLCALLTEGGIPYRYTVVKNNGHEYPKNFESYFTDGLNWLKSY